MRVLISSDGWTYFLFMERQLQVAAWELNGRAADMVHMT